MFIRKAGDGNYYVNKIVGGGPIGKKDKPTRNWWLVKYGKTKGLVKLNHIYFPETFVGKKVRFKIELVEE
jgi:hypothetical protein